MLRLTRFALRHPLAWMAATAVLTLFFGACLQRLTLDTDGASLHPASNPLVLQSAADRETFHDAEWLIVLVHQRHDGPPVASPRGFALLRQLDGALRALPGIRSAGVRSLASWPEVRVGTDSLSAASLLDDVPADPAGFAARLQQIRRHRLVGGLLLSADGTTAALYAPVLPNVRRQQVLSSLDHFVASVHQPFELRLTGPLLAEARLGEAVLADLALLIPFMVTVLAVLFWLLLRSVGALAVLAVEVGCVLVWTLGAMALFGIPITLVTTLLPVLLMATAITDEVHLFERLQETLRDAAARTPGVALSRNDLRAALLAAMGELEHPTITAALTTALGFFAFPFTSIKPLQHFGFFSTIGLLIAVLLSFSTVPALMSLLPLRWFLPAGAHEERRGWLARRAADPGRMLWFERWIARHERLAIALAAALVALAIPGVLRLRVADNWTANFDPASSLVTTQRMLDRELWGSYRFDVVLDSAPGFFNTPQGVALSQDVAQLAAAAPGVSGVASYLDPLREIAAAFGESADLRRLPPERLDDILTLAQISDDPLSLSSWVDGAGAKVRLQLFLKGEDYDRDRRLEAAVRSTLSSRLQGTPVRWHFSGDVPIGLEMVREIVLNQLRSLGLTALTTLILVFCLERSLKATIAVLLPVFTASLLVFAAMGYAGVPLGVATSMFGSLALGVGIDFGLHFLHSYRQEQAREGNHAAALAATFRKTGKALRWGVTVLALSFLVLRFSALRPNHSLGELLAAAMLSSYVMTLLLLPGLVQWATRPVEVVRLSAEPEAAG
ncbi:MAG TPA: MMPL family transporter [Thermoanaerobaculia bacterium]|nr:MMPL family transporter [Thermoanaerobaculia bacterium]